MLFTTFDKGLASAAGGYSTHSVGPERTAIMHFNIPEFGELPADAVQGPITAVPGP